MNPRILRESQIRAPFKQSKILPQKLCAVFISFLYLFFCVNKAWSGYFVSTIYLGALILIPFFARFQSRKLALALLILQLGGGAINKSYAQIFTKFPDSVESRLVNARQKSHDLLQTLAPLAKNCANSPKIYTDNPAFEWRKLGLNSRDIIQHFGLFEAAIFDEAAFMRDSNSKNLAYFANVKIVVFRKDSPLFDANFAQPNENFHKSRETIAKLADFSFQKFESAQFYIWVKNPC